VNKPITQNGIIDSILDSHKDSLGKYFEQYRNHVYRVYNFAIAQVASDGDRKILSIAAAYHDLGIWTNNTFDYLKPSIELAKCYCVINSIDNGTINEIGTIINDHHKLTKAKSRLAELFRLADMTDLTFGVAGRSVDKKMNNEVRKAFPNKGFHLTLCRLFAKNLIKNPWRPLPMYKV
jgi:hypothetical protein